MHKRNILNKIIENQFEIHQNEIILNHLLYMKSTIDNQCPETFRNKFKSQSTNNLLKIAQENQGISKRLYEKKPHYNFQKMEKDFLTSRYYKKNICEFPSIDFMKKKNLKFQKINCYLKPLYFSNKLSPIKLNRRMRISNPIMLKNYRIKDNNENFYNKNNNSNNVINNYCKKIKFNELGECSIKISNQNEK